jgi:prophage regulatory protein
MTGILEMDDRLLSLAEVKTIVGLGKSRIYTLMRDGEFPEAYKPGGWSTRWSELEVRAWAARQRMPAKH